LFFVVGGGGTGADDDDVVVVVVVVSQCICVKESFNCKFIYNWRMLK
jgi:hypothetical protein